MVSVETLVFAWNLLRLKSDVSYLYLMPMPASESLNAPDSIAKNMRLERVGGEHTALFHSVGDWEWCRGRSVILHSSQHAIMTYDGLELCCQPYFAIILQRPFH